MLTIAINSATQQTSVALLEGQKILGENSWPSKKNEAEKIMPNLLSLLKKSKKTFKNVENIFVVEGPGPFTGLRVGVTIANTLFWSIESLKNEDIQKITNFKDAKKIKPPKLSKPEKVKISKMNVFEFLRQRLPASCKENTAIMIKAGGEFVAIRFPNEKKEKLLTIDEAILQLKKAKTQYVFFEAKLDDFKSFQKFSKKLLPKLHYISEKKLHTFGKTVLQFLKNSKPMTQIIKPLYLQKPHITKSKKPSFV